MDFSKLSNGQKVGLISGVVLIINLFLPWFSVDVGIASASGNAFDFTLGWIGSLLAIGGAVVLGLKAFGTREVSAGSLKPEQIALLLAGIGAVLILIKLIIGEDIGGGFNADRSIGIFLGFIAAAAVTFGAFMTMKEQGIDMPDVDDFKSFGGGGDAS